MARSRRPRDDRQIAVLIADYVATDSHRDGIQHRLMGDPAFYNRTDPADTDDLPAIVDLVMHMSRPTPQAQADQDEVHSPLLPTRSEAQQRPPPDIWSAWPAAPATMSRRRAQPIRAAPTPRIGSIFAFGAGVSLLKPLPPDPQVLGLYIRAQASARGADKKSISTIERRLSSLTWNYAQRGQPLDRKDRHIATVIAGIRNQHASPPRQKEAVLRDDLIATLETLSRGTLRGLRDRAILLLGFAGGLRRSEIVGLDVGRDETEDGGAQIEFFRKKIP